MGTDNGLSLANTDADTDLRVKDMVLAHRHVYAPGYTFPGYLTGRPVSGLVYTLSGSAVYGFEDGSETTLTAGTLVFLPAQVKYRVTNGSDTPFLHITVNFTAEGPLPPVRFHRPDDPTACADLCQQAVRCMEERKPGWRLRSKGYLYELLSMVFSESRTDAKAAAAVRPALVYMDAHYPERITLELLAAECSLSQTHFRRQFRAAHGLSPIDYLTRLRLEKAKALLLTQTLTVDGVARLTGFQDGNYLCRCFREQVGVSPGVFARVGKH